ncbi:protein C19orf12 homolog [Microplitis demolitor]|uniref:protein C19orf12 homolog n=1 Tax=Microplitis demolitor TaxID=69319 RepID=UPI0004CDABE0|nr:protein C19orf12 homolog [Microplitis demolitor]
MLACNDSELLDAVCNINKIKSLNVAINSSMKSGLLVGVGATIGGLLLGPRGIAIGSLLGGLGTSYAQHGNFRSVSDILKNDLTQAQRTDLVSSLRNLLTMKNVITLAMLMTDKGLQDCILMLIRTFLKKIFNYEI